MKRNRTRSLPALLVAAAAMLTTACGQAKTSSADEAPATSGSDPAASPDATESPTARPNETAMPVVSPDPALAGKVPSDIAKRGVLDVGTDSTYAPSEFLAADGKTVQGFDIDLFDAVAAKLGLKANFISAPFTNIIPSVKSGKYQVGVSSFTIDAERLKTVEMVSYFSAGTQWATRGGNPAAISPDDACGKHVSVQTGTVQVDDATARSKSCTKNGKKPISIDQFQKQDEATAAVASGKDDAMLADSPVVAYAVKQTGGKLMALGDVYASGSYGYVLKYGQTAFVHVLADAVNELIADGTYKELLTRWGVAEGAVPTSKVDPTG